jgi:hypothetical protein
MKQWRLALAALIILVFCTSAVGYWWKKRAKKKVVEAQKREALYKLAMSAYSKDLPLGTTRKNVEDYLGAKAIHFERSSTGSSTADLVKIGQEPTPWFCSEFNVYVAFEFHPVEAHEHALEPYDSDVLDWTHIDRRGGGCL